MILNFSLPPLFGYALIMILGTALGSYLNSWMWRIYGVSSNPPAPLSSLEATLSLSKRSQGGRGVLARRSVCVHCGRKLAWFENIPLVSFIVLWGKCKTCKKSIPRDYFFVELATGLGFIFLAWYDFHHSIIIPAEIFRDLFFFALLTVIFVYDLKYYLIVSNLVWAGAVVALIINYFFLGLSAYSLLLGMAVGSGFFLLQYIVSKGRWIGGGDVRLGVLMGALLGWPNILAALFISYILGAVVALPLLIFKKKGMRSEIPFGTFLSVGTLVALFWGSQIVHWYSDLIGW